MPRDLEFIDGTFRLKFGQLHPGGTLRVTDGHCQASQIRGASAPGDGIRPAAARMVLTMLRLPFGGFLQEEQ